MFRMKKKKNQWCSSKTCGPDVTSIKSIFFTFNCIFSQPEWDSPWLGLIRKIPDSRNVRSQMTAGDVCFFDTSERACSIENEAVSSNRPLDFHFAPFPTTFLSATDIYGMCTLCVPVASVLIDRTSTFQCSLCRHILLVCGNRTFGDVLLYLPVHNDFNLLLFYFNKKQHLLKLSISFFTKDTQSRRPLFPRRPSSVTVGFVFGN